LRPGFTGTVRVGFGAFSGTAHAFANFTAPSMRPFLQRYWICRGEISHRFRLFSYHI